MNVLGEWRHLCVDMQRMFAEDTPWKVQWMDRVCDQVVEVTTLCPERTIFTRFVPPHTAEQMRGTWRDYYRKWSKMTMERLHPELICLLPELARFVPPAIVFDKQTYSPWIDGRLQSALAREGVSTLVVSGGETDVCVLAAVLGGIDLGYRVILLEDAVCSGTDETHDASLKLLGDRFSVQLELTPTESFLSIAASRL